MQVVWDLRNFKEKCAETVFCGIPAHLCSSFSLQASLARHLAAAGFDSWILEVRGSGLSKREGEPTSSELGGTDGALNGAVQDAFVQATVKSATKAAEKKGNGAVAQEKNENPLKPQSNALAKVDKSSKEEDSVASRMTSRITQISQTLRSLVSEGQSRVSVANLLEQVKAGFTQYDVVNHFSSFSGYCQMRVSRTALGRTISDQVQPRMILIKFTKTC